VDADCFHVHLFVQQAVPEPLAFLQHLVVTHLLDRFLLLFRLVERPLRRFIVTEVLAHLVLIFIVVQINIAVNPWHDLDHHLGLVLLDLMYLRQIVFVQPARDAHPLVRFDVNHFGFVNPHDAHHVIQRDQKWFLLLHFLQVFDCIQDLLLLPSLNLDLPY